MSHLRNGNEYQRRNGLDDFYEFKPFKRSTDMRKCDNCSKTSLTMNYPEIMPHQSTSSIGHSLTSMSYNDGYPPQFRRSCPQPFPVSYHQNPHQSKSNGDMQSIMQQTNLNAYNNHHENRFGRRYSKQRIYSQTPQTASTANFSAQNFSHLKNEVDIELPPSSDHHQGNDYCDNVPLYYYDDATHKFRPVPVEQMTQMRVSDASYENPSYGNNFENNSEQTSCNQDDVAIDTENENLNSNDNADDNEALPDSKDSK